MDAKPNRIERVVILVYDTKGGSSGYSIPSPELLEIEQVRDDWPPPVAPSAAEFSAGDA